jgi:hypothetical protein
MVRAVESCLVVGAIGVLLGCGGQSSRAGTPGTGGAAGTGAAGSGGGGAAGAGADGSGGVIVIVGGAAGAGGTIGTSGGSAGTAGGAGGGGGITDYSGLPPCLQPMASGTCNAAFPRYGFDPATLRCVEFVYGGCGANENNFATMDECAVACEAEYAACEVTDRARGCPCTTREQCGGTCSNALYELAGPAASCAPSYVGICAGFGEGSCVCPLEGGNDACGV